ncbi:MAG: glycosyltransferase family 4 protein [Verrucomicrobia bacterium]|nr:glycosyltransferase family 4 protein [Verrucomicrobiota bacterium]
MYARILQHHEHIHRLQVSHSEMEHILLETGIAPEKLHRIPIGINLDLFPPQTPETKRRARAALGIPPDAFVIGSFQKDGEGWGDGLKPKLIKGPDIFAQTLARLRHDIPSLHVLLSGPARGYLKEELRKLNIPHTHRNLKAYPDIANFYHALDAYLVASRQEGGPKAVLESMAASIPLVTTRVGQAMDLVRDGQNGYLADIEDTAALAERLLHIFRSSETLPPLLSEARKTAEAHAYPRLDPLWKTCFEGFVEAAP